MGTADPPPADRTTVHAAAVSCTETDRARGRPTASTLALALARACHPGAVVAVTGLTCVLALSVGHGGGRVVLVTAAVFCGQLSVGWSNDALDAGRDARVGRTDKPVATGVLSPTLVWSFTLVALLSCVGLSLACGVLAGGVHLVGVAAAWAYNMGLKATPASAIPYALGFASLPALVTLSLPTATWPAYWVLAAAALLGAAAHLADALTDLDDDVTVGVRGLPHRLGRWRTGLILLLLLVAATTVLVLGPAGPVPVLAGLAPVAAAVTAGAGLLLARVRPGAPFVAAVAVAALAVGLLVVQSAQLS